MKRSIKIIGGVTILVLFAAAFFWTSKKPAGVNPEPTIIKVSPSPTSSSKYTPEFKAKARSEFITSCKLKVGQQYTTACECGADYLAANYSDTQLEKAYVEYHSSNTIPAEVQAAYEACKNK
jgi:hypothetical protein